MINHNIGLLRITTNKLSLSTHQTYKAVIKAKEKESGITIHYVNEHYDEGNIIAQFSCTLTEDETVASLQAKIHQLEQDNFPKTIEKLLN